VRKTTACVVFFLSIVLTACAPKATNSIAVRPSVSGSGFSHVATHVIVLGRASRTLAPPMADTPPPRISPATALRTGLRHIPAGPHGAVSETFGLFTDVNEVATSGGSSSPEVQAIPTWIVILAHDCALGPGGAIQPSPTQGPCKGTWYAAVNAQTGAFIESFN
jgi:hypothetical protein